MNTFHTLSVAEARQLIADSEVTLIDIRDSASYHAGHIEGAQTLDPANIDLFLDNTDRNRPVIVYCYHGISSRSAAQYLLEQGFTTVYSLNGGFEAWKTSAD